MNNHLGAVCDDFSVSTRLHWKLELSYESETILRFFEQVSKAFPSMRKLRRREDGCIMLEEDVPERSPRRWVRIDPQGLRFGCFDPADIQDARTMADLILDRAPLFLGLSNLNYDYFEVVYGFDLDYRGNHDELLADTFWAEHPLSALLLGNEAAHVVEAQPYLGIAMTPECDLQAYVEVKSRTTTYEVRSGEYDSAPLSVYLTIRKYWGYGEITNLVDAFRLLSETADEMATERIVPVVVNPLANAIAGRP